MTQVTHNPRSVSTTVGFSVGYVTGLALEVIGSGRLPGWMAIPVVVLMTIIAIWVMDR